MCRSANSNRPSLVDFLLLGVLLLAVFFSQPLPQTEQHVVGGVPSHLPQLPADGQGIYDGCLPSQGQVCWDRLTKFSQGGFRLVINYGIFSGSDQDIIAYADHAQTVGIKVIWSLKDQWQISDTTQVRNFISLVKNHPATWGHYINDEATPTQHSQVRALSDLVHQLDPTHPRLSIGCAQCNENDPLYDIRPFGDDSADVIGTDYYPIKPGWTVAQTESIASSLQTLANKKGKQTAMVLQAFSWNDVEHQCDPFPECAPFPTYDQMRQMRDLVLLNAHPRLILWYYYPGILMSDNPTQHWNDLVAAAGANGIPTSAISST
jgi:hypothetical protein